VRIEGSWGDWWDSGRPMMRVLPPGGKNPCHKPLYDSELRRVTQIGVSGDSQESLFALIRANAKPAEVDNPPGTQAPRSGR